MAANNWQHANPTGNQVVRGCITTQDHLNPNLRHIFKLVPIFRAGHVQPVLHAHGAGGNWDNAAIPTGHYTCCPLDSGYPWKAFIVPGHNRPVCMSVTGRMLYDKHGVAPVMKWTNVWENGDPHWSYLNPVTHAVEDPEPATTAKAQAGAYVWGPSAPANMIRPGSGYPPAYGTSVPGHQAVDRDAVDTWPNGNPLKHIVYESMAAARSNHQVMIPLKQQAPQKWEDFVPGQEERIMTQAYQHYAAHTGLGLLEKMTQDGSSAFLSRGVGGTEDVNRAYELSPQSVGPLPQQHFFELDGDVQAYSAADVEAASGPEEADAFEAVEDGAGAAVEADAGHAAHLL